MRDRYLVMMGSGRSRLDGRFERATTFDPTVGLRSNFFWSFRMPFHGVNKESILGDDEVWSSHASWTVRKAITFNPTVGSRSNFYCSFRMPFSMQWMRDRYLVMMRSGRSRLDGRFERAITFYPTVGSRSHFYWSFRMPFSMQWMRDRYLVMMRSGRSRLDGRFERP